MARKNRNYYKGGIYHLIHRGNNKAYIFEEEKDKAHFLKLANEVMLKESIYVLAYVLMDNHYHFLVEMKDIPINQIMHKLNLAYSKYFNIKYCRIGSTFGERYRSIHIKDQAHFLKTVQYILFNPVRANIVKSVDGYRWSSHYEMNLKIPELISKWRLLKKLDKDTGLAEKKYRDILLLNLDSDDDFNPKPPDANSKSPIFYFHKHWSQGSDVRKNIMGAHPSKG